MLVLLPKPPTVLADVERSLSAGRIAELRGGPRSQEVEV